MNSRERILSALSLKKPDKVPYMELFVDVPLAMKLLNKTENDYREEFMPPSGVEEWFGFVGRNYYTPLDLCKRLSMDAWCFAFAPEDLGKRTEAETKEGKRAYLRGGSIASFDDVKKINLTKMSNLEKSLDYAGRYIEKYRGDYAVFVITYSGMESVIRAFGLENFSLMIYDNLALVEEVLDIYTNWVMELCSRLNNLGFDFFWFADDIAHKSGLMFSPDFYREICLPRFKKVTDACRKPIVYHTDGNIYPVMEDLISLGLNGIHPIDPNGMDIFEFHKKYKERICIIGNIDINRLSIGKPEEVYDEVRKKVTELKKSGGYIMSSSNTLTVYCDIENVNTMINAFNEYR